MPGYVKHIFVCQNRRPAGHPRGCCAEKGSETVRALFKQAILDRGLKGTVRANEAGCLDQCEHGISVVVYPDAVWYGGVRPEDVDEIVERHIVGGEVVERLLMRHMTE
ncbi:MAG: (2Fe-2S) ferredoxin domain-containing protein [Vicinamibacteria bacterium]